jgi:hypothetical protein
VVQRGRAGKKMQARAPTPASTLENVGRPCINQPVLQQAPLPACRMRPLCRPPQSIPRHTKRRRTIPCPVSDFLLSCASVRFSCSLLFRTSQVSKLARAGDSIYVMHAEQWASGNAEEGPAIEARKQLLAAATEWQRSSADACAPLVNLAVDVIAHESSLEEGMEGGAGATWMAGWLACLHVWPAAAVLLGVPRPCQ